ncbi:siderophore-interacting protein [Williamsia sterculiae]|uniref:NADPH-dependent ferric siderophore reductase, contains FAD-binding and SIP domains n=1 Tax=Williamsia sterculiae TaxID=1344003 RepID=A0A1N7CEK5_9NOCA|nr:siderophore-interacting protein [Williamsia sterculiae]SIR62081.1 NADPH-dependent ferric siderophore reductase, contains FAD-binding and SIP domains [Williamsia sterculiae]
MGTVFGAVVAISDPGPRIRRVVLDVPFVDDLGLPGVGDEALCVWFPAPGAAAPPAMQCRDGVWQYYDPDTVPQGRNYTVRTAGPGRKQLTVDLVLHERGVASDWARSVQIGGQVVLSTARSWYRPDPNADWQLLVADLAGLPAVARIVEGLPADARATVIVEVADERDLDYLPARDGIEVISSVGTGNGHAASALTDLVRDFAQPQGRGYCWSATESGASRDIRKYFRRECGWVADQFDIVGYWRFDSEKWDAKFERVSEELVAVYTQALADGKSDKIASEEFDLALERAGL